MKTTLVMLVSHDPKISELCNKVGARLMKPVSVKTISPNQDIVSLLNQSNPGCIIVDHKDLGSRVSSQVYQKVRGARGFAFTPILSLVQSMTSDVLAVGSEYGIFRLIAEDDRIESLKSGLEAVLVEISKPSGLRTAFQKLGQSQRAGHFGEADRILEDCYQLYRDDLDVLVEYGTMCLRKGKLEKAEMIADRLANQGNEPLRVSNFIARVRMKQGNFGGALTVLDRANMLSPQNLDRLVLMGDVFRVQGKVDEAEDKYTEVLSIDPENKSGKKGVGLVALSQGDANRALEFFRSAFTEEETGSFFNNTAVAAVRRKQFERASKLYSAASSALESEPLRARVAFNMGLMYRRWAKPAEAMQKFTEAQSLDPEFKKAQNQLERMASHGESGISVIATRDQIEYPDMNSLLRPDEIGADLGSLHVLGSAQGQDGGASEGALTMIADQGSIDLSIFDFADSNLGDKKELQVEEEPIEVLGESQNVRMVDLPSKEVRPFSIKSLVAKTGAKPPGAGAALNQNLSRQANAAQQQRMKRAAGQTTKVFIDDDDD